MSGPRHVDSERIIDAEEVPLKDAGGKGGVKGAAGGAKATATKPPPYTAPPWVKKVPGLAVTQAKWGHGLVGKLADGTAKHMPTELTKLAAAKGIRVIPIVGNVLSAQAALNDFKSGNIIGGSLHALGAVPGPIGWLGALAGVAYDATHHGGSSSSCGEWDAPDGTNTHMLPAAAAEVAKVVDSALTDANKKIFGFQDGPTGTVWGQHPPDALRLDTQEVKAATDSWLKGLADVYGQIDRLLQASGEPYLLKARSQLQSHFAAMAKLPSQASVIVAQLTAASDAASNGYDTLTKTNGNIRRQLSGGGSITDPGTATSLESAAKTMQSTMKGANEKLASLFSHSPVPPLAPGGASLVGHRKPVPMPKPAMPAVPAGPAPAAPPAAKTPEKSDLDKLLGQLGKQAAPQMPQMPHMGSPMGGGSPLGHGGGTPLGGGGGTPLGQQGRKIADDADRKTLADDKKTEKAKLSGAGDLAQQKAAPVPGAAAATGPAAAGKPGAKPAVAELKTPTEVDVKGHKVSFPDAKTAKLAQLLAAADPAHPLPLSDAAAQAGLVPPTPGQDPGQQVAPSDSRPGDILVAGDKRFLMLGDAQFYDLDQYKMVGASELPRDMGSRAGYFHLLDPATGGAAGAGPVSSPPAGGVPFNVPGGTGQTGVPTDASPSGVTSTGTPGVPAQGGAGPANVAATDTGLKESVPSAAPQAMDPGAVK